MQYNSAQYNEQSYQYFQLSEIISLSDTLAKTPMKTLNDSVFPTDLLTKQFSNKALGETIHLDDWQSHNRKNEEWFDE